MGLRIIDFDDCGFGYFLYDIATLLDRIEWSEDYASLRAALLEGYRQERSLSPKHEALLDLFCSSDARSWASRFLALPNTHPARAHAPAS